MTTSLNNEIRARIDAFVADMSELLRQSAVEAAVTALQATANTGRAAPSAATLRALRSSVSGKSGVLAAGLPSKSVGRARKSTGAAGRRSPKEIDKTVDQVLAYVKAHPAERSENIRKALKLPRPLMTDAIKRLIAAKKVTAKGEKRATRYSPA